MVSFSGAQGSRFFKDVEARRVIHDGSGAKVGCTMLNKNKNIFLFDDGNLDHIQMSYLSSLCLGYVSLRHCDSFFIEPYLPYRFSRQFGFCQDIPSAIACKGSMSRVCAPCPSLNWHKLKTTSDTTLVNFARLLSLLLQTPRGLAHMTKREMHTVLLMDMHPNIEGTGDNVCATSSKRLHLNWAMDEVEGEDKRTSDAESEINFKHQRGRRSKKPRTTDLKGDETDLGSTFDNIPILSYIPIDLTKVGDIDFEMGASFNIDYAMIEEAIEPLNVLTDRTVPGKGKGIYIERELVDGAILLPLHTHHSIDGPATFEINAKTLGIPLDVKGIPRAPSHGDVVPAPSLSTIRITPASQGIFT
ncbi:Protein MAINTENANCE OF MERISTEMS [Bienertia sinuspersici]